METLSYKHAVQYIRKEHAAVFAFVPEKQGSQVIGGEIYILAWNQDVERDPEDAAEYYLYFLGGRFGSSSGEEETYWPEDIPDEAKQLTYRHATFRPDYLEYEVQIVLKLLEGQPLHEVLD